MIGFDQARLIVDPPQLGWKNMAADYILANSASHKNRVTVRIFEWDPTAVSLGFHQKTDDVNVVAVRELGWDLVRRPTGGRTLLHSGDVCYSIVIPRQDSHFRQLRELYSKVAEILGDIFHSIGLNATLMQNVVSSGVGASNRNRLCIDSNVRGEIHIDGRKIAGASQRLFKRTILQQGSIMLNSDPGEITKALNLSDARQSELADHLRTKACPLNWHLKERITTNQFVNMLSKSFNNGFVISLEQNKLSAEELKMVQNAREMFDLSHHSHSLGTC